MRPAFITIIMTDACLLEALYVAFIREPCEPIHYLFDGAFSMCGIFVGKRDASEGSLYVMRNQYTRYAYKKKDSPSSQFFYTDGMEFAQSQLEFVQVKGASSQEIKRVYDTCEACCDLKRGYNFADKIASFFGISLSDQNVDIYTTPRLHGAQATLLILRATFVDACPAATAYNNADNAKKDDSVSSDDELMLLATMKRRLLALNSRTVYPTQLYRVLLSHVHAALPESAAAAEEWP